MLPFVPPTSSSSRSPRIHRKPNGSTLAFVLTLCVPYIVAANPLPVAMAQDLVAPPFQLHRPTSSVLDDAVNMAVSAAEKFAHAIQRRNTSLPHPIVTLAHFDTEGAYTMPSGYVQLNQRFNGAFIFLSYAIAFIGSLCTLELLIRRTTNSGWKNQFFLTMAGLCFGAVSTFSMHFIFNNSLSLHHPLETRHDYPALYLAYDPGFTVLSLVASCFAMTIAFFIMGTHLSDWWCCIGGRKKKRRGVRSKNDEYGSWKETQKKKGSMGIGALFQHASSVAKWSLMDVGEDRKSGKGKSGDDLGNDKGLQDLDFRLGRSAVKVELERLHERTSSSLTNSPPRRDSVRESIRLMPSNSSLPQVPSPVYYPSSRRGSAADGLPSTSTEIFNPAFSFPARPETASSSTANLIPSASASSPEPPMPIGYDTSRRRASLPTATYTPNKPEPLPFRNALTLSRIQSLPEADVEITPSADKKLSITADLDNLETSPEEAPQRRARMKEHASFTRLEKFLGFDVVTRAEIIKIFVTGTIAGFGVASMHYIGQLSITGMPYVAYKAPYVVGSIIIASGAVIIALYIMFIMLRPKLKHNWLSKIGVAIILSIAVCAMHFCGMMGTIYAWPRGTPISSHDMLAGTNGAITGIVAALAFATCMACCVFLGIHSWRVRREHARRRRVVVAAVFLDSNDRILVSSTDGLLPMCDIASLSGENNGSDRKSIRSFTRSFSSEATTLGMDLTTSHDAFVSAVRMSWSWKTPAVLAQSQPANENAASTNASLADTMNEIRRGSLLTMDQSVSTDLRPMRLSVAKFLERFVNASGQLSSRLIGQKDGIARLGVLYDQILTTGWVKLSQSNDTVSKGQLIFLVRRISSSMEKQDLLSRHFIFAETHAVASALTKTLSVPLDNVLPLLEDVKTFCDSTMHCSLKAATLYAGVAVVQATPFDGLRVLLEADKRSQLPIREICTFGAAPNAGEAHPLFGSVEEIGEAITWLDGMSLLSVMTRNMTLDSEQLGGPRVAGLLSALERAIVPMLDEILSEQDMTHILPRLTLHPVLVPLTPGVPKRNGYIPPYLVVFYANYDAAVNTFTDKWLPFSLFRAQNACVMAQKIQAAYKADSLYQINEGGAAGYNYGRRPSKVQFEFPAISEHASPLPNPSDHGLFKEFSFPAVDGSIPKAVPSQPRRSSLAGRSRFGSIDKGESPAGMLVPPENQFSVAPPIYRAPGVANWDPEWLLNLLRNKLHAEA